MGTWGYGLYSDDVTRDVKDIYVDKLRRGKSGMQASKEMIAEFKWALDDEDDAPVIITTATGSAQTYITLALVSVSIIAGGVILIKKFVIE